MSASRSVIVTIGYTGERGGAGRATLDFAKIAEECLPGSYCVFATDPPQSYINRILWGLWWLLRVAEHGVVRLLFRDRVVKQSLNSFGDPRIRQLLRSPDSSMRFHLHWIANSTIAIRDFAKIPSGTLITLHDEWLISGSSHYAPDKGAAIERGRRRLLNPLASFLDRRVYARKKKAFSGRDDLVVTVPSAWMKRRVEASGVFDGAIVKVIPNGVDTEQFAPASDKRCDARGDLGISEEDFLICFGADHSARNPIKGTDLFLELLSIIAHTPEQFKRVSLVVVGGLQVAQPSGGGVRIIDAGQIRNREALANLFRASDVLLHLSRLEAFGLVPCEAMSCGTPVICFDNTGASELVIDGETGFVCAPFEVQAVADAISDLIAAGPTVRTQMSAAARKHMVSHYSLEKLSERYGDLLKEEAQTK